MHKYLLYLLGLVLFFPLVGQAQEKEMSSEEAWNFIKTYEFGDDWQALLFVTDEVQKATVSPESRTAVAEKLAGYLNDETTYAGRQFVCMQLRLVGTASQVPLLASYLQKPDDAINARLALTDIICEESLVVLRNALQSAKGQNLAGIIGAIGDRNDKDSMEMIASFCASDDPAVAQAAVEALAKFGGDALNFLNNTELNVPQCVREASFVKIACSLAESGKIEEALSLFNELGSPESLRGTRRAAFQQILKYSSNEEKQSLIYQWLFEEDNEKNVIAASHLKELSEGDLERLYSEYNKMGHEAQMIVMEVLAEQKGDEMLKNALEALKSDDLSLRLTAIRTLGRLGDLSVIPTLISLLDSDAVVQTAVKEALQNFSPETLNPLLIEKLENQKLQDAIIACLAEYRCYGAIDPLIELAKSNKEKYSLIVEALSQICDPDDHDIPRLLDLYLTSSKGKQRENIERAIVTVCEKNPDAANRIEVIVSSLNKKEGGLESVLSDVLPLLGKLGNSNIYENYVKPNLTSDQPALQTAAYRALCNWPNTEYLSDLWSIAENNNSQVYQQWAIRAYIRLATLKSDRPETETLEMLKNVMKIAKNNEDKRLCLQRAEVVRTIETVDWVSSFLDEKDLAEAAASTVVELAHHRFLREPNKEKFQPILLKIETAFPNSDLAEKARKARLGM